MTSSNIRQTTSTEEPAIFRKKILDWYDKHRRILPWRALPNQAADPYRVWLSEIMLQQTTVQAVIPYFLKFTKKWPDIYALANADNDEVMSNWAGLGYYARARNLHKCAKIISEDYGGVFPFDQDDLKKLPGIGDYTSAAIASIAFDKPATVVDGNVERVMARYHACDIPLPDAKKHLKNYARIYAGAFTERCGDYAQALMDLGATICTPKSPLCHACPVNDTCAAFISGKPEKFPVRLPKQEKPKRFGHVYWITNEKGQVLVHKRPEKGLLGGMLGLPTSQWIESKARLEHAPLVKSGSVKPLEIFVTHVFTHFHLSLNLHTLSWRSQPLPDECIWIDIDDLESHGFPTVFKKALNIFINEKIRL